MTVGNILSLREVYRCFFGGLPENLNTIKTAVKKMLTALGSTYICNRAFSVMNFTKKINKFCLRLPDKQLYAALRVNFHV
jgi:hypothetical protein